MKRRRKKYRLKKRTKKAVILLFFISIMLTIAPIVKNILFDKEEPVNASIENAVDAEKNSTDATNPKDSSTGNSSNSIDGSGDMDKKDSVDNNSSTDNSNNIGSNNNTGNSNTDNSDNLDNNNITNNNDNNININSEEKESSNKATVEINLENYAFVGDSITEALSYYKIVNPSNVIANKGYTAKKALADIDKLVSLNPDKVFIMLGLNDILTERSVDRYIKNYTALIREINKRLPNAKIYVQSILPVDASVKNSKLAISNAEIDEFNEGLKKMAMQENIHYLDVASVVKNFDVNLREPDGIHYKAKFCDLWLQYIAENI